jgi:aspartyl-tRNA(Asn)/glutamyl-tRNA(Gln) amidotransferase subunit A
LVAFAIGSETSGSILTPAAFCGISGLRPTYGLVSRYGAMALCWTLDKLGPMCRTADDCGIVLAAISGRDPKDPSSVARKFTYEAPLFPTRRLRVGIVKGALDSVQPEVRKNFEEAVDVLKRHADIEPDVALPDLPYGPVVGIIVNAEGASAFRDLIESGRLAELQNPRDRIGGYVGMTVLAVDYLQAQRVRTRIRRALDELLSRYDALIAPTRATVAYPIGVEFERAYPGVGGGPPLIPAGNAAGVPALSIPNGFGQAGLPTALHLMGRAFSEATLIALANAYQRETEWHRQRPPLSA